MPTAFFCIKNMFPFRFYNLLISRFLDYLSKPAFDQQRGENEKKVKYF